MLFDKGYNLSSISALTGIVAMAAACMFATGAGAQSTTGGTTTTATDAADPAAGTGTGAPPQDGAGEPPAADAPVDQGTAQSAAPDAAQAPAGVKEIVEANLGQPEKICAACTPLILANPAAAAELIEAAKQHPELAEQLAQCLSRIQQSMKASNPEGAQTIAALIATAPPAFQAAYAVALAPDGGGGAGDGGGAGGGAGGGGGGGGAAGGAGDGGGGGGTGVGGVGFGGFGGGGGGGGGSPIGGGGSTTVSPSEPNT